MLNLQGRWNRRAFGWSRARDASAVALRYSPGIAAGRVRLAPSEGWHLLDRQVSPGFSRPCRDLLATDATPWLAGRVRDFFVSRQQAQQVPVFLHKLTGWPRAGLLSSALDDVRFIHVVRDGRAVANSWLQMGWWDGYQGPDNWFLGPLEPADREAWEREGRSFPVLAALGWQVLMRAFAAARARVAKDRWLDLRYEDLLADPAPTVDRLTDFVRLRPDAAFDRGLRRHAVAGGRSEAFRRDLDPESIAAMERVIAPTLRDWGYQMNPPRVEDTVRLPGATVGISGEVCPFSY